MNMRFLAIGCGTVLALTGIVVARAQVPGSRSLQASVRFVDTTVGSWEMREQPELARTPTLVDLTKADPAGAAADFGLSFNCAVKGSGAMADCRPIYASPDTADKAALARALARYVRVTPASARLAREKAYRLTIDVALNTADRYGSPKECRPPFCMIEGAVPPPSPVPVQDPIMAAALDRAQRCFETMWQRTGELRFAAEKTLRDRAGQPATDADRQLVLDYVTSRHALAACISSLRETARVLPLSGSDAKAVSEAISGMKMNYDGQARYEQIILIGLLDASAANVEAAIQ